jgi:hypothetical protein
MRGSYVIEHEATPAVTAGAYAAADVVGGLITVPVQTAGGWCILNDVVLVDDSNVASNLSVLVFNEAPTTIADNGASSGILIADLKKLVEKVDLTSFYTVNSNKWGRPSVMSNRIIKLLGASNLYVYIVDNAGFTLAATDAITIRLSLLVEGQ